MGQDFFVQLGPKNGGTVNQGSSGPDAWLITGSVTTLTNFTGTVQVPAGVTVNNFPALQAIAGIVDVTVTGSAGLAVGNAPYAPLYVSVTSSLPVTFAALPQVQVSNFPAVQAVSGSVALSNWPAVLGVSASAPLQVYSSGTVGVSGSVALTNWPSIIGVSGTVTLGSQVQVSNFPATQAVSGSVALTNWPAVLGVSSSSPSGFWSAGPEGITGSVALTNWPLTINVSASAGVRVFDTGVTQVSGTVQSWNGGTVGVSGSVALTNWPSTIGVSGSTAISNWPSVLGVSSSSPSGFWTTGPTGITGSTAITNWPLTVNVTSSAGISLLPTSTSTNAATFTSSLGPGVPPPFKGSAGTLYKVWATNRSTGSVFLQLFNRTTAPTFGLIPIASFPIEQLWTTGSHSAYLPVVDFSPYGINFSTGIALGFSSVPASYLAVSNVGGSNTGSFDCSAQFT